MCFILYPQKHEFTVNGTEISESFMHNAIHRVFRFPLPVTIELAGRPWEHLCILTTVIKGYTAEQNVCDSRRLTVGRRGNVDQVI